MARTRKSRTQPVSGRPVSSVRGEDTASSGQPFGVVHPNTAGIDVHAEEHFVAVPPECDPHPVRAFGCYTPDLLSLAAWLKEGGIQHVVMESRGGYWVNLSYL